MGDESRLVTDAGVRRLAFCRHTKYPLATSNKATGSGIPGNSRESGIQKIPRGNSREFRKIQLYFIDLRSLSCKLIFPHFSNLKYGIKIALVHRGTDAEQTEFAVFNNCQYLVFFSKRNTDVEISISISIVKIKYRISVRFCGIPILE